MNRRILIAVAITTGLAFRLLLAWHGPQTFDHASYRIVIDAVRSGQNIYAATDRCNYTPLWSWWLVACADVADALRLDPIAVVRTSMVAVDALVAGLLALILRALGRPVAWAWGYWLNPAAILIVGLMGQFEPLALCALLAAVLVWLRAPERHGAIWLLGTLAVATKHLVLFEVWVLFLYAAPSTRRAVLWMAASGLATAALFVPYLSAWWSIVDHVLLYRSVGGFYGMGILLPAPLPTLLLVGVSAALPLWLRRHVPLDRALLVSALVFLALVPGIGLQYLTVPLVLATLVPGAAQRWIAGASTAAFLLFLVLPSAGLVPPQTADVLALLGLNSVFVVAVALSVSALRHDPSARQRVHARVVGLDCPAA